MQDNRKGRHRRTRPTLASSRSLENLTDLHAADQHARGLESDPDDDRHSRMTGSHDDLSKRTLGVPSRSASFDRLLERSSLQNEVASPSVGSAAASTPAAAERSIVLDIAPDSDDDVSYDGVATVPVSPRAESEAGSVDQLPLHTSRGKQSPRDRRANSDPTQGLCKIHPSDRVGLWVTFAYV
jgi:hypothetical protein